VKLVPAAGPAATADLFQHSSFVVVTGGQITRRFREFNPAAQLRILLHLFRLL